MLYQTNPKFGLYLNRWGCYFFSLLQKVTCHGGVEISEAQALTIYTKSMTAGAISLEIHDDPTTKQDETDGVTILQPAVVFNIAASEVGAQCRCRGVRKEPADVLPGPGEDEILELRKHDRPGQHFVAGTGVNPKPGRPWQDEIEFDPIEGGSNSAKIGYIASKRIMTIQGGIK